MPDPSTLADEQFCYLTTTGRVTGNPHEIKIWFGVSGKTVYMLSGGRSRSDWVKNLKRNPLVSVRIGSHRFGGVARTVDADTEEDSMARRMLVGKYQPGHDGDLTDWGRTSLPVAIDIED